MDDSRDPRPHCREEYNDRLSELPEPLILQILSFLPTEDVVETTFLSKRWNDVWTCVPCLDFRNDIYRNPLNNDIYEFRRFVRWVLEHWKGLKVHKFRICTVLPNYLSFNIASDINDKCVLFSIEKQVEDLSIDFILSIPSGNFLCLEEYMTPKCLYSCSSVRKLSLVSCKIMIEENVQWNKLESLTIRGVEPLNVESLKHIMCGSPRLEVLNLSVKANREDFDIRSTSLKVLKIHRSFSSELCNGMLRVRAPNLKTLEVSGISYEMCFLDVPSLTSAIHGINVYILKPEIMRKVFQRILNVEKFTLSDSCPECDDWMSDFLNLHNTSSDIEFPMFPKLTTLVLELKFLSEISMNNILSNVPQLQVLNLSIWESNESLHIVSPSLRIFKIHRKRVDICNSYYTVMMMRRISTLRARTMLRISAPNLETLEISGYPCLKYLLNVPSITKAVLAFDLKTQQIDMLWGIFQSILHVEELALSNSCIEVLLKMKWKYNHMPLVANAKVLKLYASAVPEDIFGVFEIFPLMTMLVIKHTDLLPKMFTWFIKEASDELIASCFNLRQLKRVEIRWPMQDPSIHPVIESLLRYAHGLEKMVFRNTTFSADPESR